MLPHLPPPPPTFLVCTFLGPPDNRKRDGRGEGTHLLATRGIEAVEAAWPNDGGTLDAPPLGNNSAASAVGKYAAVVTREGSTREGASRNGSGGGGSGGGGRSAFVPRARPKNGGGILTSAASAAETALRLAEEVARSSDGSAMD